MEDVSLTVPDAIVESLPADGDDAARDMQTAVAGWESRLNRAIEEAEDDDEAAGAVVDALERFEDRWEQYDDFVVELRAWGQSPIYAMAWRDLQAALIRQLHDHEDLADRIDRERHARLVSDGIRPGR
ncbi:hypothetical protein NGM10_11370 [Halorussus salilacus]|uniref:hypothetical protein n=1 Tax=Halorussus salilacus TaxID=2953750 RepID=UPI0020A1CF30|nr:hypothetical protein [Halorussus salilacus]USZ67329.1 hypothetical protein NGM10_11370 [Halorussus salilacus]